MKKIFLIISSLLFLFLLFLLTPQYIQAQYEGTCLEGNPNTYCCEMQICIDRCDTAAGCYPSCIQQLDIPTLCLGPIEATACICETPPSCPAGGACEDLPTGYCTDETMIPMGCLLPSGGVGNCCTYPDIPPTSPPGTCSLIMRGSPPYDIGENIQVSLTTDTYAASTPFSITTTPSCTHPSSVVTNSASAVNFGVNCSNWGSIRITANSASPARYCEVSFEVIPTACPGADQICQPSYSETECSGIDGDYRPCLAPGGQEGSCCYTPALPPRDGCCYPYGNCPEDQICQLGGDYLCSRDGQWTCVDPPITPPPGGNCGVWRYRRCVNPDGTTLIGGVMCRYAQHICCNPDDDCPGGGWSEDPPVPSPLCSGQEAINTAIGCIPIGDRTQLINFFLRWGMGIGGGIALVLIVVGGLQVTTASGDPKRLQAGRELITAAVMGLVLLIFSAFILRLIGSDILGIF